jgi:hypothetical protein
MNWKKTQLGNVEQFGVDVVKSAVYIMMLAYFGGSMTSLCRVSPTTLNELFPIRESQVPYQGSATGDHAGLFEFFWPMHSVAWPYTWINTLNSATVSVNSVSNWLARSCMYTFISVRKRCQSVILNLCKPYVDTMVGDAFVFYVFPHLLLSAVTLPIVWMIAWVVVFVASFQRNGIVHVLAPIVYPLELLAGTSVYGLGSFISAGIMYLIGCCVVPVYLIWWVGVSAMVWFHVVVLTNCVPFMFTGGTTVLWKEIRNHRLSLMMVFMILTILSSIKSLIPGVTTGLTVMSIYLCYKEIRHKN